MIYLDNAATTNYKPQEVIDTVTECLTKYPYNPNRSGNKLSLQLQQKLYDARRKLHLLLSNDSEMHVAFTGGCTAALNLAILGTASKGHIIITATEHNSVLRPVMQLKKKGYVDVSLVQPDENGQISAQEIERLIRPDTYLICVSHASNVTGTAQKVADIGALARRKDIKLLVDCAQSIGYFPLDMLKCNVDMVAIAAHKGLHAMQGAGALIFSERAIPRPINYGGTGSESHLYYQPSTIPDSLESGTLPCPAILAMNAGVDWWLKNWQPNRDNVVEMQSTILNGLKTIKNVKVYSHENKSGIVAFNIGNRDSTEVSDILSERYDIAVRGGLQCAPLMHKYLGTLEQGVVRASVSCITTKQECYSLLNAVELIAKTTN
ncbi:MAG: aminotransferase class V-fold PLP-dependent enzyme [Clostridiales bacterium]|nr:aminotransferase class V-fold PLP-dependent enzyme [Clostridiales bacterium]